MTGQSVAWRSCNGCTRSISTRGPRSGGRRAGPALPPVPPRPRPWRVRRPQRAAPQEQARAQTRVANQGATTRRVEGDKEMTIPVVEEDISIGKREVERGHVRIYSRVTERPVEESVRLREEKVTVERRPVDRPATDADFAAGKTSLR